VPTLSQSQTALTSKSFHLTSTLPSFRVSTNDPITSLQKVHTARHLVFPMHLVRPTSPYRPPRMLVTIDKALVHVCQ